MTEDPPQPSTTSLGLVEVALMPVPENTVMTQEAMDSLVGREVPFKVESDSPVVDGLSIVIRRAWLVGAVGPGTGWIHAELEYVQAT